MNEIITLDLRDPNSFALGHLEGSINLPYSPAFFQWAQMFLKPSKKRIIVLPDIVDRTQLLAGFQSFENESDYTFYTPLELQTMPLVPLLITEPQLINIEEFTILDVRTPDEWNHNFIKGALAIELSKLANELASLPKDKPIAVICASGTRSSIAASFLLNQNFTNVSSVRGGMNAWARLP